MRAADVIARLDGRLSKRMLDFWLRTGQVVLEAPVLVGSGKRREFTETEFRAIARMVDARETLNEQNRRFASGELWAEYLKEEQDG